MGPSLPLTTLLSQLLVAFTIEFDNEAEHRIPHRTTLHGKTGATSLYSPWLVSMAMWFNCMQHLGDGPIPLPELERRARTPTNLHGMQRWGYILVTNETNALLDFRPQPRRVSSTVRATAGGEAARQLWAPLFAEIEERWNDRFGSIEVAALRSSAKRIVQQLDPQLPDCMPILGYGLISTTIKKTPSRKTKLPEAEPAPVEIDSLPLPSLLARILLALALEFESESPISLAIYANVIRVLTREGVRVRDLPALSGVSKESIAMAFGILRKKRLIVVEKEPKSPWQIARLTEAGAALQNSYPLQLAAIEARWESTHSKQAVRALRKAVETIAGNPEDPNSLLLKSTEPHPDGWRAFVPQPRTLPHFPMVLHRGGYPDGS